MTIEWPSGDGGHTFASRHTANYMSTDAHSRTARTPRELRRDWAPPPTPRTDKDTPTLTNSSDIAQVVSAQKANDILVDRGHSLPPSIVSCHVPRPQLKESGIQGPSAAPRRRGGRRSVSRFSNRAVCYDVADADSTSSEALVSCTTPLQFLLDQKFP